MSALVPPLVPPLVPALVRPLVPPPGTKTTFMDPVTALSPVPCQARGGQVTRFARATRVACVACVVSSMMIHTGERVFKDGRARFRQVKAPSLGQELADIGEVGERCKDEASPGALGMYAPLGDVWVLQKKRATTGCAQQREQGVESSV